MKVRKFKGFIFHPFLFGTFPILSLLANNISEVRLSVVVRPLALTLMGTTLLVLVFRLLLKNWNRAAIAATLSLVLFFSYGHVYAAVKQAGGIGIVLGRHRYLLPIGLALYVAGLLWIARRSDRPVRITEALNAMGMVALLLPVIQIIQFEIGEWRVGSMPINYITEIGELETPADQTPPDIYYIILDAYTREDVLRDSFALDNTPFLRHLDEMGFDVAHCSQSNYAQTSLSLATALNMSYHESLQGSSPENWDDSTYISRLILHSTVREGLENLGYTIVAFETGFQWLHWEDADIYITPRPTGMAGFELREGLNSFEVMLLDTSAGLLFTDAASVLPKTLLADTSYPNKRHRERILYNMSRLRKIPRSVQSPKFVYVHLIIPHAPFVFGHQGERVSYPDPATGQDFVDGYRDQVIYINHQMEEILAEIIARSERPPVIILQGDHGPGNASNEGRMAILNTFYLPGGASQLPDTITPVNTFRVVFNRYFGGDFALLPDISYFSTYQEKADFRVIPNTCTYAGEGS